MGKVIYNMSTSLDGFVRAWGYSAAEPLGHGGHRVHDWFSDGDPVTQQFVETKLGSIGAVVTGRRTFDDSAWGADGPTGIRRLPVFVLTHNPPVTPPESGVYTFITDGIESAVAKALAAAQGKDVSVMGGPTVGNQAIGAGVIDEIVVSMVPVLFGDGLPMFSGLPATVELERLSVLDTAAAVHITYRVVK